LVEVLVSVLLVSTVVLALVTGLLTLVRTTESNNQRQQIQLALGNMSESARGLGYRACDGGGATDDAYESDYFAIPANWTPTRAGRDDMDAHVVRVEFWNPTLRTFQSGCPGTDGGAQQLTLEISWRDQVDTTQVVIRR
jgi:type II secretory pathway pseudopilin PulG